MGTPGIEAEWAVAVDIRGLAASKAARSKYSVRLTDGSSVRLNREYFEPVTGFIAKLEGENVVDIVPDPNLPDSELSYSWYGFAAHPSGTQWLQFTVQKGNV